MVPLRNGEVLAKSVTPVFSEFLTGRTGSSQAEHSVGRLALTDAGLEGVALYAVVPGALRPNFAADTDGRAYISTILGAGTQITAFARDTRVRWVAHLQQQPNTTIMPADVLLDGVGRVYVMPRVNRVDEPLEPVVRTVDVLDGDGNHLGALKMDDVPIGIVWQEARGEYIYGVQADPVTFEWEVARYRVELSRR
jgi:hypothetical protein